MAHEQAILETSLPSDDPRGQPEQLGDNGDGDRTVILAPVALAEPEAAVFHLEAWMPEKIAEVKLRGFVNDVEGDVLESVPGLIRVRIGGKGSAYAPRNRNGWLGLNRRSGQIDVELQLQRTDPARDSLLHLTILMRPTDRRPADDQEWRDRAAQIFCDLRGYLMGLGS